MPERRRQIPSVDALLRRPSLADLWQKLGPAGSRRVIAEVTSELRSLPSAAGLQAIESELRTAARRRLQPSLRPVINATGIVLHTNLGRAPMAPAAAAAIAELAASYSNLEFDLDTGRRGRRDSHLDRLLAELTGAEASLVVNNNAAAILLALNTLAEDDQGEILVSRGELVEIGESFRISEIIARGGARLVEVGSTNRTRLGDYQKAVTPRTRVVLRVHRSNFVQHGFVAQPALEELGAWAHRARLPLVEDLGSGCLTSLPNLPHEPVVRASIAAGVDLVTYSGDKLLGGPQAGIVSGRGKLIQRLRSNPLFRALRVDRLTYGALEATLAAYARGAEHDLPVFQLLAGDDLERRTQEFAATLPPALGATVEKAEALVGGGAAPGVTLPSWAIRLRPRAIAAAAIAAHLRAQPLPVVVRIDRGCCCLDLRTVLPAQLPALRQALADALGYLSNQSSPSSRPD